jgi:DNA-binding helix-hairpin-helix protein with protein kinase domain
MAEIIINSKKHGTHVVLVDDEDFDELNKFKWYVSKGRKTFYAKRNVNNNGIRTIVYLHRQIMNKHLQKGLIIDHINHNGLDNRKCNLRIVTRQQNQQNTTSRKNSTSKYLGVSFSNRALKWYAKIKTNNKNLNLGYYVNENDAAQAYNKAALKHFGEYANLNKI